MVSFRFHIVSITAIFLAIAVGVVIGSTFVDRVIVDSLRSQIDRVSENLDERRADNARLEAEIARSREFAGASAGFAVSGRLTGTPVLVLAARGVDDETVRDVVELAEQAGADVPGIAWIETAWALEGDDEIAALRRVLGAGTGTPERLRERAFAALAAELEAVAPDPGAEPGPGDGADPGPVGPGRDGPGSTTVAPPASEPPASDPPAPEAPEAPAAPEPAEPAGPAELPEPVPAPVTEGLVEAGFLSVEARSDQSPPLSSLAGRGPSILVVTGTEADPALGGILAPLVEGLADAGLRSAVGEVYRDLGDDLDAPARGEVVAKAVLEEVRDRVAIVDHLDLTQGRVAAVLALAELGDGAVGHYGYGSGAQAVLPPWSPP